MKSPAQLAARLARDWQRADLRQTRLDDPRAWPVELSIGRPAPSAINHDLRAVKRHLNDWRSVKVGKVEWHKITYRALAEPLYVPVTWLLSRPTEWVEAAGDAAVRSEFERLTQITEQAPPEFHSYFIRKRSWRNKLADEVIRAAELAAHLQPGMLNGAPLRSLSAPGIDTKFAERHRSLLVDLLDIRHNGLANELGLEGFLGAADDADHWLLVADLDGGLLPYSRLRVRTSDLETTALPAAKILVVENEQSLFQLPNLSNCIAILGAGLNLRWISAAWLSDRRVAYWGDIDGWGLVMLARARLLQPDIHALLMDQETYLVHIELAVVEPQPPGSAPSEGLMNTEVDLYRFLLNQSAGRLEQELLRPNYVQKAVQKWVGQV